MIRSAPMAAITTPPSFVSFISFALVCPLALLILVQVFCMEYGIKMFYYAWSAYKRSAREAFAAAGDASYPFSVEKGMRAFPGLISSKEFIDEETDTYGIMYWSADSIVLSFRGTASRKNVVTDLKATTIRYEPCPHIYGFPVLVHKGFWKAWSTVRERVIGEVLALAEGGGVERLFVTGHSLGGALACLCSVDLQAEFNRRMGDGRRQAGGDGSDPVPGIPGAEITLYDVEGQRSRPDLGKIEVHTYTFGAPRVGNTGFGAYANSLLSNYWHVVNTEDPVARIPKGPRYARSGHRVLLGRNGNMEIYPSHFESSLFTNVGGKVADHMMRTYATRLGQFIKAQFVPDLAVCDSEAELNCVRRMARNVEAESLGLEGLLCCSLGHLEDGLFELSLHPDCVASAPAELKQQQEGLKQQKQERTGRRNRRWLARLLPGRLKSTSADDSEIGSDSHGANRDEQGQRGENDVDEDELDMDFEEGLDDKVLQVLKGVWGD